MITENKIIFGEIPKIWSKKNKNIVVIKDAMLPGILLIFPIPNSVTNKKMILFIII